MIESALFIQALKSGDQAALRQVAKADLHCHFPWGSSRQTLAQVTGAAAPALAGETFSMAALEGWRQQVQAPFASAAGRLALLRATLLRAKNEGVTLLETGEEPWAMEACYGGDVVGVADAFQATAREIAPALELRLQISLSRRFSPTQLEVWAIPMIECGRFASIDLYGDETLCPIEAFAPLYRRAKKAGLRLQAHVGEWGSADDVVRAVETLELDEIHHGIAAAGSPSAMHFLAKNHVRCHIAPTSNLRMGRVEDMAHHPIATMYREGVEVTVGTDNALALGCGVTDEFLALYSAGTLTAPELDEVRRIALRAPERVSLP